MDEPSRVGTFTWFVMTPGSKNITKQTSIYMTWIHRLWGQTDFEVL